MTIEYTKEDEAEMLKIACLVLRFNPYAAGFTPEDIVADMKRTVLTIADGYVAVSGWMVTVYRDGDGRTRMKASLPAHLFDALAALEMERCGNCDGRGYISTKPPEEMRGK